ncbi:MAG TPA: UDP-glucuronic acid decarboxylase family protein [Pyrinomonadaceae bacterium]|nr:UDP-glucuronic acid decarboxylase family protein [Pyrinomonadaceae bacterium]
MRILVTGGAGFVGSHLCERLLVQGHEVTCLDNFFTGRPTNVGRLLDNSRFQLLRHDLVEPLFLRVDQIYNLACPGSPVHYQSDAISTIKTSVIGAMNILELAKESDSRVLQTSSSEVYGDPQVHPQPEEYWGNVNPTGIRACYDESKRLVETLFMAYHRQHSVDVRIARIFNGYGPRMSENDGRVVSNLIMQAIRGEPLTLYGSGDQTRSFCYVSDLVDGLICLMNTPGIYEPVNLGNPVEITMSKLAQEIANVCGVELKVVFRPLPEDDPKHRQPDITRARRLLQWAPKISLTEGLAKMVAYSVEREKGRQPNGRYANEQIAGNRLDSLQLPDLAIGKE